MFFSRVVAAFLTISVTSQWTGVAASPLTKRADISDVLNIVNNLQSTTSTILPQIDALTNTNDASISESSISPLLTQLVSAINGASNSLDAINTVEQNDNGDSEVANAIAPVISTIQTSLNAFQSAHPNYAPLVARSGVHSALGRLLRGVERLVGGVLRIVVELLAGVVGLLDGVLGF